jgi:hypothetical protein
LCKWGAWANFSGAYSNYWDNYTGFNEFKQEFSQKMNGTLVSSLKPNNVTDQQNKITLSMSNASNYLKSIQNQTSLQSIALNRNPSIANNLTAGNTVASSNLNLQIKQSIAPGATVINSSQSV